MRRDMHKVLTERTRVGGGKDYRFDKLNNPREKRSFQNVPVDLSPKRESIRKRHRATGNSKEFRDLHGPLRRYLRSQVGRPWDDVWADICQVLRGTGLQVQHVKNHVKYEIKGVSFPGKAFHLGMSDVPYPGDLYVDDKRILRVMPEKSRKRKPKKYNYFLESDSVEYHKLNGCWFRVQIGTEEYRYPNKYAPGYRTGYRSGRKHYVKSKRALSSKEAKVLDLDNRYEIRPPKVTL